MNCKAIYLLSLALLALLLLSGDSAQAITNGQPDGTQHPYVGRFLGTFCTGVAISPTLVVTAAHCVDYPGQRVRISFNPVITTAQGSYWGTLYAHPDFCLGCEHGAARSDTHDIAVFVLDTPMNLTEYAVLAPAALADSLPMRTRLTIVGYGFRGYITGDGNPLNNPELNPVSRYFAETELIQSENLQSDEYLKVTANPAQDKGGVCFGDSGGPALLGNVVLGITSMVSDPPCAGVAYMNRLDLTYARDFISSF